jgi:hypothetical protein
MLLIDAVPTPLSALTDCAHHSYVLAAGWICGGHSQQIEGVDSHLVIRL